MAQATGTTVGRRRRGVFMPIPGRRCVLVAWSVATVCGMSLVLGAQPAADPIVGTWRLNPALTKVSPGMPIPPPSARTEVYRQTADDRIELTVTSPNPGGASATTRLVFSRLGGVVAQENAAPTQMLIETRISPGHWRVTYLSNGVQFLTMEKSVSPDGRTMQQKVTGLTPKGDPFEGVLVFDRE